MAGDVLIGLIGVGAGALATGGVQALAAIARRRNESLASARIVWNRLATSTTAIEQMIEFDRWVGFPSFQPDLAVWEAERRALAHSMGMIRFHAVSATFNVLAVIEHRRSAARLRDEPDEGWSYYKSELDVGLGIIAAGKFAAWEAGHRRLERLTMRRSRWLDETIATSREERETRLLATEPNAQG